MNTYCLCFSLLFKKLADISWWPEGFSQEGFQKKSAKAGTGSKNVLQEKMHGRRPKGPDRFSAVKLVLSVSPSKLRLDANLSVKIPAPAGLNLFRLISPKSFLSERLLANPEVEHPADMQSFLLSQLQSR